MLDLTKEDWKLVAECIGYRWMGALAEGNNAKVKSLLELVEKVGAKISDTPDDA